MMIIAENTALKQVPDSDLKNRPLLLFLIVSFGIGWGIAIVYITFGKFLEPIIGQLTINHPLTIIALYAPSFSGLLVYYVYGGWSSVGHVVSKVRPRWKDLSWYLTILAIFAVFALYMRYGSIALHQKVPEITLTSSEMTLKALWILIKETGLIGGLFGWIGFLLPYLQARIKKPVVAALLTGLAFGIWVLPGYFISSVNSTNTLYLLYVVQLMVFIVYASFIFNVTEGNLLLYVLSFWLAATGSHIQLYYFTPATQLLEIVFFIIASIAMAAAINLMKLKTVVQTFSSFRHGT